jgi:hypothetical protein
MVLPIPREQPDQNAQSNSWLIYVKSVQISRRICTLADLRFLGWRLLCRA